MSRLLAEDLSTCVRRLYIIQSGAVLWQCRGGARTGAVAVL
jgi:hypothetical protein